MEGVDVWGRSPYGGYASEKDLKLRVLKTGDSMTGNLIILADPIGDRDAATKQYVDSHLDNTKVLKAGDSMTGDLYFSSPVDQTVARYLGCSGLEVNKQFTILMGNLTNSISYTNPGTINIQSSDGTLFRLGNTNIMRVGTDATDTRIKTSQEILLGADIDANDYTIKKFRFPS